MFKAVSLFFQSSNVEISIAEKHGTCSSPVFNNEYDYFLTTLNVYFKYNVTVSLWSIIFLLPRNFFIFS